MIKQDSFILAWMEDLSINNPLSSSEKPVFEKLDLKIDSGEYAVISGIYGTDRINFINVLGCLCRPDSGKYIFDYNDITTIEAEMLDDIRSNYIGFIFKGLNIIEDMTVYRNIELPLLKYNNADNQKAVEEAAERLGLIEVLNKKARLLSDIERQKVAVARALVVKPILIIADEPGEGLSRQDAAIIMDILSGINEEGKAVVVFSDNGEIVGRANRHIVFEKNKVKTDNRCIRDNAREGAV